MKTTIPGIKLYCRFSKTYLRWQKKESTNLKKIVESEEQKEKRLKKNEQTLRDNIRNNLLIVQAPKGEEKDEGAERIFKEIMANNFLKLMRYVNIRIRETP